ncbi:hypothetical protein [Streptomyces sp. NPDC127105]|uniref:hypothetical protein n=1 Tax=Streptomyces sp. NPDC127105 TaxID=3345359 RepID=UPI00366167A6
MVVLSLAPSSVSRARRRLVSAPLHRLFEVLVGPVATRAQTGSFWRGLQAVAVDGTALSIPNEETVTWRFPKRGGQVLEFRYTLLRLVALVECGTRALLRAAFGHDSQRTGVRSRTVPDIEQEVHALLTVYQATGAHRRRPGHGPARPVGGARQH